MHFLVLRAFSPSSTIRMQRDSQFARLMERRTRWDHLLAAGVLIQEAPNIPEGTPLSAIPGFGYLILKNNELLRTTPKVSISYRKGLGRHGVEALNIPLTPEGDAIVREIKSHSPEWSEEPTRLDCWPFESASMFPTGGFGQ